MQQKLSNWFSWSEKSKNNEIKNPDIELSEYNPEAKAQFIKEDLIEICNSKIKDLGTVIKKLEPKYFNIFSENNPEADTNY